MTLSNVNQNLPWVFVVLFRVDRDDAICRDAALAHRAHHGLSWLIHPGVDARPAIQVPTLTYDWLFGSLEADVTLENGIRIVY